MLVKQVFSSLEVLGWYTNGTLPVEDDTKFHEQVQQVLVAYSIKYIDVLYSDQICSVIESHLLVKLNTIVNKVSE